MRELIQPLDASHEASIRLALEAAGIDAVVQPTSFGFDGAPLARVYVVHDRDFARAAQVVAHLQRTIDPVPIAWRLRLLQVVAVVAFIVILVRLFRRTG